MYLNIYNVQSNQEKELCQYIVYYESDNDFFSRDIINANRQYNISPIHL